MISAYRIVALVALLVVSPVHAAQSIQERLTQARPGETVELPAGEIRGGFTLPAGVSLKGAGIDKTSVDATGMLTGITVDSGSGAVISDLTVRGAQGTCIVVKNADSFTLKKLRATGGSNGFLLKDVKQGRLENCISDHNAFGITVNGSAQSSVVNCTIAACAERGLNLAKCTDLAVFNNCIAGSSVGIEIDQSTGMHVDYNLYSCTFLGSMKDQIGKRLLSAWQYLSGLDAHSVQLPVEFKNLDGGDFSPTNTLPWALDRATTSQWGIKELAGVKAPPNDILEQPRDDRPDLGAYESTIKPPRSADGQVTVSSDAGVKSAGVFTKDGRLVSYLFQNLPLSRGTYSFWLPLRDYVNQPIKAGEYEVRLAESDFRWKYLNHIADNGEDRGLGHTASFNPEFVAYAPNGILVLQEGLSEDHTGVRGYDALTGKLCWHVTGSSNAQGIAVGRNNIIYVLREQNPAKGESRLTRINADIGEVIPWPGSKVGHVFPTLGAKTRSLALLGDWLYAADAEAGKLFVLSTTDGTVSKTLDVPAPRFVASDEKTKVLWVVSGDALIALTADGKKVAESKVVPGPVAVAARDGRLAVASGQTGKVHFFDANDPTNLKPAGEFGKGDGPFGPVLPDRFLFQTAPSRKEHEHRDAGMALGESGQLAVVDQGRTLAFDSAGKNLWYTIGVFGNHSKPSFSTGHRRFWDQQCNISFRLNEQQGTWEPETVWDHSLLTPAGLGERHCLPLGDFKVGDKQYFVAVRSTVGAPKENDPVPLLIVARIDGHKTVPVLTVLPENGNIVLREDSNGDGRVDQQDPGRNLTDANGKPLPVPLFHRFVDLHADGSITTMWNEPLIWRRTGVSALGNPAYQGKDYVSLLQADWRKDVSPYDFKPDYTQQYGGNGFVVAGMLSDGGSVIQASIRGSGGSGMSNGAGTDLCGYGPDGRLRWVHQLAQHKGLGGMGTADDITLTSVFYSVETMAFDADGLALGGFCEAPQLYYCGYWIDHPNLRLFKMPDNQLYATMGSNADGRHPWYRLENQESLKRTRQSFRLAEDRASELAALNPAPAAQASAAKPIKIRIPQLTKPMPIDGDLEKWRKAGIQPQITIRPYSSFDGPGDCSALIRMAYEGQNLYFQILQFDDKPIFYQMVQEDCVELALNGAFGNGFQFVVYKTAEGEDIIWRNRFFDPAPKITFDPKHAPRVIRVLDSARDVTERASLEATYGVDLSNAKVVLTEFMLPIDKTTYGASEHSVFPLGPGKSFWVGFFIDDNDTPYTDVQSLINWPSTFGMFSPQEDGAFVECD